MREKKYTEMGKEWDNFGQLHLTATATGKSWK
jgi:hypothetical protein